MKKLTVLMTLIIGFVFIFSSLSFGVEVMPLQKTKDKPVYVADQFVVTFQSGAEDVALERILGKYNIKKVKKSKRGTFTVFKQKANSSKKIAKLLKELSAEEGIATVEQSSYVYMCATPNDSYYGYQWHYPIINMDSVWNTQGLGWNGGSGVKVAVIDTGVRETLSDLSGVNFANGYDFANNDNNADDDNGHGSHVCGTIAQTTNNSYGCAGMAGGVTIIPVKVLDSSGSGYDSDIADGIEWATDQGADIINLSLGGYGSSTAMQNAVNYAHNNGVLVVCAKGNDGVSTSHYPSDYTNSFAVAATHSGDSRASYSNYNSATDIAAPGGDGYDRDGNGYIDGVLQQTINGWYFYYGTSMATPHVVGLAALILDLNPTFTNTQIRARIENTAVDKGSAGKDIYYGWGRIDAYSAVY